jgi:hypothetical protein
LSLVATLLGKGHSEIKPRVDDAVEAVAKASHLRE